MIKLNGADLRFILEQILIAEQHAAGTPLRSLLPNSQVPFGLRTVDGSFNNLVFGQSEFGAADNLFPRLLDPVYRPAENAPANFFGPGSPSFPTSYAQTSGFVFDSQPRFISNAIVDATPNNPAAVDAADGEDNILGTEDDTGHLVTSPGLDGEFGTADDKEVFEITNQAPDVGLSAPFNGWMTFFGQFFDHGLDLVAKGGNSTIFIPLKPDDPLYVEGGHANFMVLTRATQTGGEHTNTTSPFVDQNQTYSSHASHQVFLRQYELNADGQPVATGKLITGGPQGGMANWGQVKAQARELLGIDLTDADVGNVPLLATDPYGMFIRGPNGFAQVVMRTAGTDGIIGTTDDGTELVEGNPFAPISLANAVRTGHAFLDDIAHSASPRNSQTGAMLAEDADDVAGVDDHLSGTYDNELLERHFIAGDGRVNENIGLTAVHHVFHAEHNRLVDATKATVLESGDLELINGYLLEPISEVPADTSTLVWNGERLFQAAKVGTEMQYQHLVFEEFARKIQPNVDVFLAPNGFDATINPSIVAEFAHVVYRFGHSMLTETIDRLDPNFASSEIGLIKAFLNPLAFDENGTLTPEQAAGAIVRGVTRQAGNEIDEFVTEAVRNNLLGLPLDLAAINIARGRDTGIPSLNEARRQFFEMTQDSQLKPYESWADFSGYLKYEASLFNFIAAYGQHQTILDAETLEEKRAAAADLILGGDGAPADRHDFLYGTGAWAGVETGLNLVDLWVGGLAEEKMPFGGMLGSTFNFVFETQMESLQNGDRLYYLGRLAGTNFLTELENNSFAKLVMAHTDVTRLPADIFSTPGFILEVDPSRQYNEGLGSADPTDPDNVYFDLVSRDDKSTDEAEVNYLKYTGDQHVVLGGTEGDDTMIASEGDDTLWGDGGNDRLEGGYGNDILEGGAGDDIITDAGGDDLLQGGEGNDVLHGGQGENLIIGGTGKDFIITGEDFSETFAGEGDDFILGAKTNLQTMGGEGNDWIELGTQDGAPGDNFDPFAEDAIAGHDVFVGGGGFDEMIGEGGDDIFVGSDAEDHFDGMSGYDWATYKNDRFGVTVDMTLAAFDETPVPPSSQSVMDEFAEVEGLSGSAFGDVLRGDNVDPLTIVNHGGFRGSVLENPELIDGLQEFLGQGVTSFGGGNIILGGAGSDIIEGRGGDDLIDGDKWLNVRVSVRSREDHSVEIRSVDSIKELVPDMLSGAINPSQLEIVREILDSGDANYDTAVFSDVRANYTVTTAEDGTTTVTHNVAGGDGSDRLTNIERLQFADQQVDLPGGMGNARAQGQLTILDQAGQPAGTPVTGQLLRVTAVGVTDANNTATAGAVTGPITYVWQAEFVPGTGVFTNIETDVAGEATRASGQTFTVTPDLAGLSIRAMAIYADQRGVLETAFSAPTAPVIQSLEVAQGSNTVTTITPVDLDPTLPFTFTLLGADAGLFQISETGELSFIDAPVFVPGGDNAFDVTVQVTDGVDTESTALAVSVADPLAEGPAAPHDLQVTAETDGFQLIRGDLDFILEQIKISERHAAGEELGDILPNSRVPLGLRTVSGEFNNLVQGTNGFGAADQLFPRVTDPNFRDADDNPMIPGNNPTSYAQTSGNVFDSDPRTISNLIVDQTANNQAAYEAAYEAGADGIFRTADDVLKEGVDIVTSPGLDGVFGTADDKDVFFFPNEAADVGLSAPFSAWMTFFGQFFDHGLDLVAKGGSGTIFIPLQPDDPLYVPGGHTNFMVLTRATNQPGADGILGTADDVHEHTNTTSPFVDQNQTYSSHPSHQVFLRAYELDADGKPRATGRLIENREAGADGEFFTADDVPTGGMATWAVVKAQAAKFLGIELTDADVGNVPLLATDAYGMFLRGPNGFAQVVMQDDTLAEGNPLAPISLANAVRTGHAFLDDIAHFAAPVGDHDGNPSTPPQLLTADADGVAGGPPPAPGFYDDELLDAHYIAGDGRVNENIGLTAVHHIFHAEHNRALEHIQHVVLATGDANFIAQWQLPDGSWNGERLFQAAKFTTEMQYQHLVFEEFARTIQPQVDIFFAATQVYDTELNPAIVAEFAHTVYRFGHSMLTETIDRLDPNYQSSEIGLIEAFLNPLAFAASGPTPDEAAGAIVRGVTRQVGNEIDEFVTEALRNNLLGLPLDLPAINIARGRDTGIPSLNAARREFYNVTGDTNLKPYASWAEFVEHIKHPASLINFIAAYGTHATILDATTLDEKRAAAMLLVFGGAGEPADRLDFLNSTGDWVRRPDGTTTTGLDNIDLWIGGLAEEKMPFGGMLGSTFNFVFEEQLEKLQDGDRFYYLDRTAGQNFLSQLENNSFAKMIMANTDAKHLPALVFTAPGMILEVDQTRQYTGLGADGRADPVGDSLLTPLVMRDDPNTDAVEVNYLRYTGDEHVVMGGTDENDTIIASEGDDTLWGDGGDDKLEGGYGNDNIEGGDGNDIVTDIGGDDVLKGNGGHDAISAGNGINLVIGGHGSDFILINKDAGEAFGGPGNDFVMGGNGTEVIFGNEGDDWVQFGTSDGGVGDNFDPNGADLINGNDVFMGDGTLDRFLGEGGDDVMIGSPGSETRFIGMSGFDWATFKDDQFGVNIDMTFRAFDETPLPRSSAGIMARFAQVEGLSGSSHSDVLRGDDADAAVIATAGAKGSVLTNIALIAGLQELLDGTAGMDLFGVSTPVTSFSAGNIILGGAGGDILEGRGGNDIIDGDAWLDVNIGVDLDGDGQHDYLAHDMRDVQADIFAGLIHPGQLSIVREIKYAEDAPNNVDTAVFSGLVENYINEVIFLEDGSFLLQVTDTRVDGPDGTDILRNIERVRFADATFAISDDGNLTPLEPLTIDNDLPVEDQPLTVSALGLFDPDNVSTLGAVTGPITFVWQVELDPGSGVFSDLLAVAGGEERRITGETFTPGDEEVGLRLRVRAMYEDEAGVLEEVFSQPTQPVENVNDSPTGVVTISDVTPTQGETLNASALITDHDGLAEAAITFTWESSGDGGATWNQVGTGQSFTPGEAEVSTVLRVSASYVDDHGTPEQVFSAETGVVGDSFTGTAGNDLITGTEGEDVLNGGAGDDVIEGAGGNDRLFGDAGADTITGSAGHDVIDGGTESDTLFGGEGNDSLAGGGGLGADTIFGEGGDDTLVGGGGNDTLDGGVGNDIVTGNTQDDLLIGDEGNDVLDGDGGIDTLLGGAGDDVLLAGAGDDSLDGGEGADTLDGGGGNDTMAGGQGDDTYVASGGSDTINEAAAGGHDTVRTENGSFTLAANVEDLTYTGTGNFTGTGNAGDNSISGGDGNDNLSGGDGADTLSGGLGDDTLQGGVGADAMVGGRGDDVYFVDDAEDHVTELGDDGIDTIQTTLLEYTLEADVHVENLEYIGSSDFKGRGNAFGNTIRGGSGNDTLSGASSADILIGNAGNDLLEGEAGNDTLQGGAGNDTLVGGEGLDRLEGGNNNDVYVIDEAGDLVVEALNAGTDLVRTTLASYTLEANVEQLTYEGSGDFTGVGNELNNLITSGDGNDTLSGLAGNDTLNGSEGNNVLDGGTGVDRLAGGLGADLYYVDETGDVVVDAATSAGVDTVISTANVYTLTQSGSTAAGVENLTFAGSGAFTGTGNGIANTITGGAGNDTLNGLVGADTLIGLGGNDTYVVDNAADVTTEAAGGGHDTVQSSVSHTLQANVEDLILTASGINGTGNELDNAITGGAGSNVLNGMGGNDTMAGGAGNDTYVVDSTGDVVIEAVGGGTADVVQTNLASYTLGAQVEQLTYTGAGAFTGTGNELANTLRGGAGNDTLDGAAGNDTLIGGAGNDTYHVDSSSDSITEAAGGGTDTAVSTADSYTLGTQVENLTYAGSGNFTGTGNNLANTITGGAGNDSLNGGTGADQLIGLAGNDVYTVDNTADVVTEAAGGGRDRVLSSVTHTLGANVEDLELTAGGAINATGNNLDNELKGFTGNNRLTGAGGNDTIDGGAGVDTAVFAGNRSAYTVSIDDNGTVDTADDIITVTHNGGGADGTDQIRNVERLEFNGQLFQAPTITSGGGGLSATAATAENGTAVASVTATDPDAGATLSFSIVGGADAGLFTINSASGALAFSPAPNFEAPADTGGNNVYDVVVQVSDGTLVDRQAIAVTVTNVNEAPVITSNAGESLAVSVDENVTGALTTVTAADPDAGSTLVFSIAGGADGGKFQIDASTGALSFISSPDAEAQASANGDNVYDVTVQVSDGTLADTQAISVTVNDVNEFDPVITSAATASVAENSSAVATITATDGDLTASLSYSIVGGPDASLFHIDAGSGALSFVDAPNAESPADFDGDNVYDVVVQVSDGQRTGNQAVAVTVTDVNEFDPVITSAGSVSVDENSNAVTTVTATDADLTASVTFSIAGGADAALFQIDEATGALSFISAPNAEGGGDNVYDVTVQVSDGERSTSQAIAVSVQDVNEFDPVISSNGGEATAAVTVAENSLVVADVDATDADLTASLSYSIVGGADSALFTIDASTGVLSFLAAPNAEIPGDADEDNVYDVVVQVSDGQRSDSQAIAVTVSDVNEFDPVIAGGDSVSVTIDENVNAVTTVTATDADLTASVTFSIAGGADAALFQIDEATGALSFISAPNAEGGGDNVYDVTVQVSDGERTDTQAIAVTVSDVNEFDPVITSNGGEATAAVTVAENSAMVADVNATDLDLTASLSYSISGGADAALFQIDAASGVLSFIAAPNAEMPGDANGDNVYDVTVQVSDGARTDSQAIAVTVSDVNEFDPVITSAAAISVDENANAVTTVTATDADLASNLSFSIIGGADAGRFQIDSQTGVLTFTSAPNAEAAADADGDNVYDVTVEVSDGERSSSQAIAVSVSDVNEFDPVLAGGDSAAVTISENQSAVTTVSATDADLTSSVSYSIAGGADSLRFQVDAETGALSFVSAPWDPLESTCRHASLSIL